MPATNEFTDHMDRFIPRQLCRLDGKLVRFWEHRRLVDGAWVYFGLHAHPTNATRRDICAKVVEVY